MKWKIHLALLFILISICESKFRVRMTKINCNGSLKTVPQKPWCQIKNIRKESYFTMKLNITRSVPNMNIDFGSYYKNSDGFRRVIEFKNIEACKIINNKGNIDSMLIPQMIKDLAKYLRDMIDGNIFDGCTTNGELNIKNLTFKDLTMLNIFPHGEYRIDLLFHDEIDDNVLTLSGYARLSKF